MAAKYGQKLSKAMKSALNHTKYTCARTGAPIDLTGRTVDPKVFHVSMKEILSLIQIIFFSQELHL